MAKNFLVTDESRIFRQNIHLNKINPTFVIAAYEIGQNSALTVSVENGTTFEYFYAYFWMQSSYTERCSDSFDVFEGTEPNWDNYIGK